MEKKFRNFRIDVSDITDSVKSNHEFKNIYFNSQNLEELTKGLLSWYFKVPKQCREENFYEKLLGIINQKVSSDFTLVVYSKFAQDYELGRIGVFGVSRIESEKTFEEEAKKILDGSYVLRLNKRYSLVKYKVNQKIRDRKYLLEECKVNHKKPIVKK